MIAPPPSGTETNLDMVFTPDYWGEVHPFDPLATGARVSHGPTIASSLEATLSVNYAWRAMMMNQLVINPVPEGERFDPYDKALSGLYYQSSGTVLVVDVEKVGITWRDIPSEPDDPTSFVAGGSELIRRAHAHEEQPTNFRAGLQFSNPGKPDELYQRSASIMVMASRRDGTTLPLAPQRMAWSRSGPMVRLALAHPEARGLPFVGRSYVRSNDIGEPVEIRRIRGLDVVSGSSMRPPKRVRQATKVRDFLEGLIPAPTPVPGFS